MSGTGTDPSSVTLGSVLVTKKGKRPKQVAAEEFEGSVPYIDIATIEARRVTKWADAASATVTPAGTLVMVWDGARSGWVGRTPFEGALGSTLAAVDAPVSSDYFEWFLRSHFREINSNPRGTGIPHVNPDLLKALELPIPSRVLQKQTVELLRTCETGCRNAVAHITAARDLLRRARQSVVLAACSGRLTKRWRGTEGLTANSLGPFVDERMVTNSRKLRRGVDAEADVAPSLESLPLPESWLVATVSKLLTAGLIEDAKDGNHGVNHPKASEFTTTGVPFITANVVKDGSIDYSAAPKVSDDVLRRLRVGFAEPGDVILTHKASIGRVAVNSVQCVLTPQTTYYRTDPELLLPKYLALYFESLYFYEQLAAVMSQTTRDFVPISAQYLLSLILPPPEEQTEIVRQADKLLRAIDEASAQLDASARKASLTNEFVLAETFRDEVLLEGGRQG